MKPISKHEYCEHLGDSAFSRCLKITSLKFGNPSMGKRLKDFFVFTGFDGDMHEKTTGCQHSMGISSKKSGSG